MLGGGGGAGGGKYLENPNAYGAAGGAGGGLIIAYANDLRALGLFKPNGAEGQAGYGANNGSNGGGGAGGSILVVHDTGLPPNGLLSITGGRGGMYGTGSNQDGGDGGAGIARIVSLHPGSSTPDSTTAVFGDGADGDLSVGSGVTVYTDNVRKVLAANASIGATTLTLANVTGIAAGDEVLVIQMQGAGAGLYEFARVSSVGSPTLTLETPLLNAYSTGGSNRAQVVRVPNYQNVTVAGGGIITSSDWNGASGGIVAFRVNGTLTVAASGTIQANGRGYRGAPRNTVYGGGQGESEAGLGVVSNVANGLGGGGGCSDGYGNPPGGGGGGYAAYGETGRPGNNIDCNKPGAGGNPRGLVDLSVLYMGGGGGAGGGNGAVAPLSYGGGGGNGGGIVLVAARSLQVDGTISAKGGTGLTGYEGNRGSNGGGGAGGSIRVQYQEGTNPSSHLNVAGGPGVCTMRDHHRMAAAGVLAGSVSK